MESLDWDADRVPKWIEPLVAPPAGCYFSDQSDLEWYTKVMTRGTLQRIIDGNLLRPIDWGAPGKNDGTLDHP